MTNEGDGAHLLATRLCHDITGPISAINNGVELLEDEELGMQDDAMELIIQSAKDAATRLQFYRLAFGHTPAAGETSWHKKRELMDAFMAASKVEIDWTECPDAPAPHTHLRLLANLLLVGALSLLKGGRIDLNCSDDRLNLSVSGPMLKADEQVVAILNGSEEAGTNEPKLIHLWLLRDQLATLNSRVEAVLTDEALKLVWYLPKVDEN